MSVQPARLIAIVIGTVALAGLLFLQAASSALTRKQPFYAAQLMPLNGAALEQKAIRQFQARVTTADDIAPAAKLSAAAAMAAFERDPLSPKSFAILALAKDDPVAKRNVLEAGLKLNRRDLMLQSLVLQDQVSRKDYSNTLSTLDDILRVHPEQNTTFFPILIEALKSDDAAEAVGGILDRGSDWHDRFLDAAARDRDALPNLAKLRLRRDNVDAETDRRLIRGLVAGGRIEQAYLVYARANPGGVQQGGLASGRLDWANNFPPFDWLLADEGGFRADFVGEENRLEVYLRSGKGGVLAERLVEAPSRPFSVGINHTLTPPPQVKDLRLQVSCPGAEELVVDQPFSVRPGEISIPAMASRCQFVKIVIYGRSWSGKPAIRGQIAPLTIRIRE